MSIFLVEGSSRRSIHQLQNVDFIFQVGPFSFVVALLAGTESIRDVIAFPKTASGSDPLTGAPAPVEERQLGEKLRKRPQS